MRLSRYAFLALVALFAHPAIAKCEFKDSRQQQQCTQQEQAQLRAQQQRQQEQQRQQQVAQQQRQQQAQQAQQRAQEQQRQQQVQRQQQEESRRVQEQQRQQLEAQQRAAQERQRQAEAARNQQEAAARQAQQQQALQRKQEQQRATASTASRTAGMTAVTLGNGQRVFANSQGMFFDASGNQISHQSVATATKGAPAIGPSPQMPIRVQPAQAADTYRRSLTVASPNAPIAATPAPNRVVVIPPSIQTANTSAYQASSAPPARVPIAVQPTVTTFAPPTPRPAPAQEMGVRRTIREVASTAAASAPSHLSMQDVLRISALTQAQRTEIYKLPEEQIARLKANGHWDRYLSAHENAKNNPPIPTSGQIAKETAATTFSTFKNAYTAIGEKGYQGTSKVYNRIADDPQEALVAAERRAVNVAKASGIALKEVGKRGVQEVTAIYNDPRRAAVDSGIVAEKVKDAVVTEAKGIVADGSATFITIKEGKPDQTLANSAKFAVRTGSDVAVVVGAGSVVRGGAVLAERGLLKAADQGIVAATEQKVEVGAARRITASAIDKQAEKHATTATIKEGVKTASQIDRAAFRTEREAFWKAEAKANPTEYSAGNIARMEGGKAPIGLDGYPIELHHKDRTMSGELEPLTRTDHRLGENFKKNHPSDQ